MFDEEFGEPERTLDPERRVIAVTSGGKGGTGKTSIASGLALELSTRGMKVLTVDLDPIAGLSRDFGVTARGLSDDGAAFVAQLEAERPDLASIAVPVRPGLDLIVGGKYLEKLAPMSYNPANPDWQFVAGESIGSLAEVWDVVIIDTPPGDPVLQQIACLAARWLLVPTKTDMNSWDGLGAMARRVRFARRVNPELDYLGAVIFALPTTAKNLLARTRQGLHEILGHQIPLFTTVIRASSAASEARNRGQLAVELARDSADAKAERLRWLKERRTNPDAKPPPAASLAGTAAALAEDYRHLAAEVVRSINQREKEAARRAAEDQR